MPGAGDTAANNLEDVPAPIEFRSLSLAGNWRLGMEIKQLFMIVTGKENGVERSFRQMLRKGSSK